MNIEQILELKLNGIEEERIDTDSMPRKLIKLGQKYAKHSGNRLFIKSESPDGHSVLTFKSVKNEAKATPAAIEEASSVRENDLNLSNISPVTIKTFTFRNKKRNRPI